MDPLKANTCFLMSDHSPAQKPPGSPSKQPKEEKANITIIGPETKKNYGHTTADVENQILDWLKEIKREIQK